MKTLGILARAALGAFALSIASLANAFWVASGGPLGVREDTPQAACQKEVNAIYPGQIPPTRVVWISPEGQAAGHYRPGFDVPGPALPNPENNYVPQPPGAHIACVYWEEFVHFLRYEKDTPTSALALTGPAETRPTGTGGTSEIALTAKVTEGTAAKAGVLLSFAVSVTANSGGHDHDSASRPKGALTKDKVALVQATSDANGEVKFSFKAPEVAGTHTIKVTCATCSNSPVVKEVQVKVPGLVEMPVDTKSPPSYTLVGQTGSHASNHWFLPQSRETLGRVARAMFDSGWGAVGVNDGSLPWGGLFDIKGGWSPSHHEHRAGNEVDLSVSNPRSITGLQKKKTYAELCKKENTAFSIQTLWHQDDGYPEHFHVYLDGTGLTREAGGGPCCARYKTTRVKKDKNGDPVLDKNGVPVQETVALCEETTPR